VEKRLSPNRCKHVCYGCLHRTIFKYFFFLILSTLFLSCGIEEYIYLYPVNTPTNTEIDNNIQFTLPASQPSSVFTGYRIYYRIYLSENVTRTPTIETDWNLISTANSTPATLSNLLENTLSYKQVSFYEKDTEIRAYPLTADSTGWKYIIDFNISVEPYYVALIRYNSYDDVNGNYFQLCRESDAQTKMLFEYFDNLNGPDINSSSISYNTAYAQFIIVATGFNSGTIIMSEATRLGVLALP